MNPALIATKQKQRSGLLMNVQKELSKAEDNLSPRQVNVSLINVSLVKLRDYHKRIQDYNTEIQEALTGDAQDKDISKMSEKDDVILDMIARLETAVEAAKVQPVVASDHHDISHASSTDNSRIRLPKIELRSFHGDPLKWDEFWDYFDTTFHSNENMPVIEKFTYLQSLLKGDAEPVIQGYRLTAANYDTVISALKERFGDPEVAIFQHFDAMLTMPSSTGEVSELQRVFDKCEAHIRGLIALGLTEDTFGRVFAPILLSKLPGNVRMELIRKKGRGKWSLAKLRELLCDEIYARDMAKRSFGAQSNASVTPKRESVDSRGSNGSHHKSSVSNGFRRNNQHHTASALPNSETHGQGQRKQPTCGFCGDKHFNNACTKYSTGEARRKRIKGKCYVCLRDGHAGRDCDRTKPCYFCRATTHHQSLCDTKFPSTKSSHSAGGVSTQMNVACAQSQVSNGKSSTASVMSHGGQRGVLQTAVAEVVGGKGSMPVRHMLDTGSDNSFINNKVAEKISARYIGSETINLAGFSDVKRRQNTYKIFEFDVVLRNGNKLTMKAYGTNVIICSIDKVAFDLEKYPVLLRVPLAEPLAQQDEHVNVEVLIGSDYYYELVKTERIQLDDGLLLLDSNLGYVVAGRVNAESKNVASMILTRAAMPQSNFDVERFWKLEEIGVKEPPEVHADEAALMKFNETVQFDEGERRYMVQWPFKTDCPPLPDNYGLAYGRLKSMIAKGNSSPGLLEKYDAIIAGQKDNGIIEEAPKVPDSKMVHYLPHHAVVKPDRATTKVRIVYDASSKTNSQQPSLNDCVHRGPVILEDLCGLLMRFRLKKFGVISDIEKAFLQVGLQKEDREVTRFLWLRDVSKPCTKDNVIVYRFCRVCFGVIASPFLLAGTVTVHLKKIGTPVAHQILDNLYVDNVIDSKDSAEEALSYYGEAKKIFAEASMNLREWYSNNAEFMNAIPSEDRGGETNTKVLGMTWDLTTDTLQCPVVNLKAADVVTKRFVLHTIAKMFDPCGYFTPVTSPAKWLMQELWQRKYDWDAPIDDELVKRWDEIFDSLSRISECSIPRCYDPMAMNESTSIELHAFCDASAKAYCAALYLVFRSSTASKTCLVFSKCRVSPLKQQSIPRLELLAATIGTRLLEFVTKELRIPIGARYLWSDSQCVLHWIVGRPVSTVFVRNRVNEIKKVHDVNFRYVPTKDNPADLPTRGLRSEHLASCTLWWKGPRWLPEPEKWPNNPIEPLMSCESREDDSDERKADINVLAATVEDPQSYPVDISRMSSLSKLIRVTGWMLRFINNCRTKTRTQGHQMKLRSSSRSYVNGSDTTSLYLMSHELKRAKLIWESVVQQRRFPNILSDDGKTAGFAKSLGSLFLYKDGIICCRGRLENSELSDEAKFPKLLPKNDPFTRLVIIDYHQMFNHAGIKQTLAELRCEYWVVNGRSQVKQVTTRCLLCRRQKGGPYGIPEAPDLPDFRVSKAAPFSSVGLDYLGPLFITSTDGSEQKVWICLFTCAVTRAVHLEVVNQMDSTQFLLCFRRFMSFCGVPELVVSDNAGQFDLSRRVLHKLWQEACHSQVVQEFSAAKQITWKFITEAAPWMGGFYERLVGVVKQSLKAALNRRRLNLIELQTVVYEVATIVNSRPLTYSEDEVGDIALTPAHLLMRHRTIVPFVSVDDEEVSAMSSRDKLVAGWKRMTSMLDAFWAVWKKQYLLSLRERCQRSRQRNVVRAVPQVGEVVLVEDKTLPRSQWRIGRIIETVDSADMRMAFLSVKGSVQVINNNHPLGRFYVHSPPLTLGYDTNNNRILTYNLHHTYCYIMLLQIESDPKFHSAHQPLLSEQLLNNTRLQQHLMEIGSWLDIRDVRLKTFWLMNTDVVYLYIIKHLIHMIPSYRQRFIDIPNTHMSFASCGTDRRYCLGVSYRQFLTNSQPSECFRRTGMNGWGFILDIALKAVKSGLTPKNGPDGRPCLQMLEYPHPPPYNYNKTVLLITDSYGKYLKTISDGNFVRKGGGTFIKLVSKLESEGIRLGDYHQIIVFAGLNELRRTTYQQQRSWMALESLLQPEINRRNAKRELHNSVLIAFTPPIDRERRRLESHYRGMRRNVNGMGVSVFDWQSQTANISPFNDANGSLKTEFVDDDGIHLNHKGFRMVWGLWTQSLPALKFVGFELGADAYAAENLCVHL